MKIFNEPPGLTVEHVLLSVDIISNPESAGQFDDSCAHIIERELMKYHGVERVEARVQYKHTKIEKHLIGCECGYCKPSPTATPGGRTE